LVCGVDDGDVFGSIFDGEEFFDALVGCDDLGLGRVLCGLVLTKALPGKRAA
jgi:hypothetical protein